MDRAHGEGLRKLAVKRQGVEVCFPNSTARALVSGKFALLGRKGTGFKVRVSSLIHIVFFSSSVLHITFSKPFIVQVESSRCSKIVMVDVRIRGVSAATCLARCCSWLSPLRTQRVARSHEPCNHAWSLAPVASTSYHTSSILDLVYRH